MAVSINLELTNWYIENYSFSTGTQHCGPHIHVLGSPLLMCIALQSHIYEVYCPYKMKVGILVLPNGCQFQIHSNLFGKFSTDGLYNNNCYYCDNLY